MADLRRLLPWVLFLSTPGCDRIQALVGGDSADAKTADAAEKAEEKKEATPAKADAPAKAEAPATAEAPAKAEAKVEVAAAPTAAPPAAATPPAEAVAAPPAADATPCIVGTWEATDYMARIDRELRKDKDLAKLSYKSHSGTIGYVVDPVQAGNKGLVRAKAAEYTYRYAGKVEGFAVSLVLVMNGETEAEYELAEPSRILVGKPKSDTMKVKASAKVTGIASGSQTKRVNHQFDGDHTYECSETELQVWDDPTKKGRPIKFKRKPA